MKSLSNVGVNIKLKRTIRIVISITIVSLIAATLPSFANTTSVPTAAPSATNIVTTETCGQRVANYTYQVPFADSPWNIPACNLAPYNNDQTQGRDYGSRMFNYGNAWNAVDSNKQTTAAVLAQKGQFMTQFGLAGDENDYSTPIYHTDASFYNSDGSLKPEKSKRIMLCNAQTCYPSNLDKNFCWNVEDLTCMAPDTPIPWDPTWRASGTADGNPLNDAYDKEMIIIDYRTGHSYELWGVDYVGGTCMLGRSILYSLAGKAPEYRLCVASADVIRDSTGNKADIYKYNQGVFVNRGMGIQNTSMIVTPQEVQAGEIRHALTMEGLNTMGGPVCSATQLAANNPSVVGKTCGFAVAPATRVEWGLAKDIGRSTSDGLGDQCKDTADLDSNPDPNVFTSFRDLITLDKMVPEGMRFKITWNGTGSEDSQIEAFLDKKAISDTTFAKNAPLAVGQIRTKRDTAKIFIRALTDYGWIIGDTTCNGAGFTTSGAASPVAKAQWKSVGIVDASSQNLLSGLFTQDNIIALDPPKVVCNDGKATTTKFACPWLSSSYGVGSIQTVTTTTQLAPITTGTSSTTTTTTKPPVVISSTSTTKAPTTTTTTKAPTTTTTTKISQPILILDTIAPVGPNSFTALSLYYNGWMFQTCSWITSCAITVSWPAATDNIGVGSYVLTRTSGGVSTNITLNANTKTYTDKAISGGITYTYKVVAKDLTGNKSTGFTKTTTVGCVGMFCGLN